MSETTKKLVDERAKLWNEQRALLDTVSERGTDLDASETEQYDKRNARMDEIDKIVDRHIADEKRAAEAEGKYAELRNSKTETSADPANEALRKFFLGESGRSFEIRATNVSGVDGTISSPGPRGGYTVAEKFHGELLEHLVEHSAMLQTPVTRFNTSGEGKLLVPKTASYPSAAWVGETEVIPQSDPTFGQASLDAYKAAVLSELSNELIHDSAFNLTSFIAEKAGAAVGDLFGTALLTGDGSEKPTGLMHASSGVTVGVTGAGVSPTVDELIDLYHSIIAPYRTKAAWLLSDTAMASVRKLQDGAGQYIFQPALVAGQPNSLLGSPVYTDPSMAAVGNSAKSLVFGDFSQYWVRLVDAFRFERSEDFKFNADVVTFRTIVRGDGKLVGDASAIKAFQGKAA